MTRCQIGRLERLGGWAAGRLGGWVMVALAAGALSSASAASARQPRPDPEPEHREIEYIPYEIVVFPHDPFQSAAIAERMKEDEFLILGQSAVSGMILAATTPVPGIEEIMCEYLRMWPEVKAAERNVAGEVLGRQPGDVCPPQNSYASDYCNEPFPVGHIQTNCGSPPPTGHPNDPTFCYQWGLHNTGQSIVDLAEWAPATPPESKCWLQTARAGVDINMLAAWARLSTIGDSRITVAVFDSGIEDCNPDFDPDRFLASELSYTCVGNCSYGYPCCPNETTTPCDYGDPTDNYGHGTFVASIIGAVADNGIGMTGIDQQCKLLAARVYNPCGIGPALPESVGYGRVIMAFEEIYANPDYDSVRIINCSFLLPYIPPNPNPHPLMIALEDAILDVVAQHRFVVTGSGNLGSSENSAMQRIDEVYTVGGVDSRGWRMSHPHSVYESSYGPSVDFMAPGMAEIGLIAQREGCTPANPPQPACPYPMYGSEFATKHNFLFGTSYASPKVCAAISLILAHAIALDIVDPEGDWSELDVDDMYEILQAGCRDKVSWQDYPSVLGDPDDLVGRDDHYGWGLIDIDASLQYLEDNW